MPRSETVGIEETVNRIRACGILPVVRGQSAEHLHSVVEALMSAGLDAIELTLTTPGALTELSRLRSRLGDEVLLGMGSAITLDDARRAVDYGAHFVVSPVRLRFNADGATELSVPYVPAALTPSELLAAAADHVPLVKLFPASVGGPQYLREVMAPMPHLMVMPSGGVNMESISDWRRAGAAVVSLGGSLIGDALVTGDVGPLSRRVLFAREQWDSAGA